MIIKPRRLPLFLWLAFVLFSLYWIFLKTPILSDISLFLPDAKNSGQDLLINELRESPAARILLLAIEGGDSHARAITNKELAEQLLSSRLFVKVENGEQKINYEAEKHFFQARYLLSSTLSRKKFSVSGLRSALLERLSELRSPASSFYQKLLPADPTGEFVKVIEQMQGMEQPSKHLGVWFSDDLSNSFLLIETKASGFDLDGQEKSLGYIRKVFSALANKYGTRLVVSGPGFFGVKSRKIIRRESTIFSLIASLLTAFLLLAGYRSLKFIAIAALPVLSALLAGTFIVSLFYGSIHGITLAFGLTIIGVTLDYPIHFFTHLESSRTVYETLGKIWPTIFLGATTTIIGFFAMMTTRFSGLAQLGLFSVAGIAAAILVTKFVLPSFIIFLKIRDKKFSPGHGWYLLLKSGRKMRITFILIGGTSILFLIFFNGVRWENNLEALSPIPKLLIVKDGQLRKEMHAPEVSHLIVLRGKDEEEVLERCELIAPVLKKLVDDQLIGSFDSVCRYLPSKKKQIHNRKLLPSSAELEKNLHEALTGFTFKKDFFNPFIQDIASTKEKKPLDLKALKGTKIAAKVSSQLFAIHDGWLGIVMLSEVKNTDKIASYFLAINNPNIQYVNLKKESGMLLANFRSAALNRLAFGLILVLLSLIIGLKSIRRSFIVLLPVFLALSVDLVLLFLIGERLSLFHLVSLLLVLGISLDYSLFFNQKGESDFFKMRTLYSLTFCCLSTVSLFGLLGLSNLSVLNSIGKTVSIGVILGYFFSLVLSSPEKGNQ